MSPQKMPSQPQSSGITDLNQMDPSQAVRWSVINYITHSPGYSDRFDADAPAQEVADAYLLTLESSIRLGTFSTPR